MYVYMYIHMHAYVHTWVQVDNLQAYIHTHAYPGHAQSRSTLLRNRRNRHKLHGGDTALLHDLLEGWKVGERRLLRRLLASGQCRLAPEAEPHLSISRRDTEVSQNETFLLVVLN